ncbi:hypothetical protein ABZ619_38960 [Streptomyces sp. NPDC007851]|uniref:hypothetical protein n=1 Tax=Streptomyces sp. NPDC007851 TaxID=3155008 RepID=UPI0033E41892
MQDPITRYSCPLPGCGWFRDVPVSEGPMGPEAAMREHVDSHSVLEYARALVAAQLEISKLTARQEPAHLAQVTTRRLDAIREAVVLWRDRPSGDVGLAVALAGILDTEQPEPPASAALVRVLAECDRIERSVKDCPTNPDFDGAYLAALGHIRRAVVGPQPEVEVQPGDGAWGAMWLHSNWRSLTGRMATEEREHAAAAVLRWMHAMDAFEGRPAREEPAELRWWR